MQKAILGIAGVIIIILGIALGAYVGIWVLLIGGAVDVLNALKSTAVISPATIGWGLVKIVVATPVGGIISVVVMAIGKLLLQAKSEMDNDPFRGIGKHRESISKHPCRKW